MRLHSSSLHTPSNLVYYSSAPLTEEEAVDKSGVHHPQFGEDHLQVPILQVCLRCESVLGKSWIQLVSLMGGNNAHDRMKCVAVNLGEAQTIEQLCEEHFAHYSQWWDNRVDKVPLKLPVCQ